MWDLTPGGFIYTSALIFGDDDEKVFKEYDEAMRKAGVRPPGTMQEADKIGLQLMELE